LILSGAPTQTQGSHASWKVLDFFLENSRTWKFWSWKVLEIEAYLRSCKVLEKYPWKLRIFYWF